MRNINIIFILFTILFISCNKDNEPIPADPTYQDLTIFFVNDVHGQLDNFSKIKHIVDEEKQNNEVIVVCSGDIFSGNPVVDNYTDKGYPIIDIMNRIGFDVIGMGNHEFDYGEDILSNRITQSNFDWVCANVDMSNTNINGILEYKTINTATLRVTFLGLLETNGMQNATIPSTHPWKISNFTFERPENVVAQYSALKTQENANLLVALTHLGNNGNSQVLGDVQLAQQFPYFDLIIGGHSHETINSTINNIPIFQSGSYLNYLGKIELSFEDKNLTTINFELINLRTYNAYDSQLKEIIDGYNNQAGLDDVIGYSYSNHGIAEVGCFYTNAIISALNVDVCFQNTGGIRAGLNQGDITKKEIYEISPFNNGVIVYEMTVGEIKNFLQNCGSGFFYSGINIEQLGNEIKIKNLNDVEIPDDTILKVGLNDYIAAVHENYFPENGSMQNLTDSETLIYYLENINDQIDYAGCERYFRYQ